jgi:hypothetical protein
MMALDELHARRLATLIDIFEDALDRIELVSNLAPARKTDTSPSAEEIAEIRAIGGRIRERLRAAARRFEITRVRPGWRQKLAGELATLWVVLENSLPKRMRGYGREFAPQDKADWEALIQDLLREIERMRGAWQPGEK